MEFIRSIAPVIVAGIVIIILILTIKKNRKSNGKIETYMTERIALGLYISAAIGASMSSYPSYFISFGTLIGFL